MTKPITLATSLVPNSRVEIQKTAVQSWIDHGFQVISLNCLEELVPLQAEFPEITCIEAQKTGNEIAGRPVVFIHDLLSVLSNTESDICGIINADIVLRGPKNLAEHFEQLTSQSVAAFPRTDVDHLDGADGQLDIIGYDCFVFKRSQIGIWPTTRFCLGMPYWDLWFPLIPILDGRSLVRVESNAFLHERHDTERDSSFFIYTDEFVNRGLEAFRNPKLLNAQSPPNLPHLAREYATLKAAVLEANSLANDSEEKLKSFEAFALFQDRFAKLVLQYLWRYSSKAHIC